MNEKNQYDDIPNALDIKSGDLYTGLLVRHHDAIFEARARGPQSMTKSTCGFCDMHGICCGVPCVRVLVEEHLSVRYFYKKKKECKP